ncbi:MAG: hypothetical protein FWC89_02690 [Defluviitaleaceae bacterium]|nr:hypothetical protein [Defluviitaleaceae bacterium]
MTSEKVLPPRSYCSKYCSKKSSRGNASVMVVVISMVVLTLVLTVLTVTVISRQVTGRYGYFYGLYDLAVAGNEQAFYVLERGLLLHQNAAHSEAQARVLANLDAFTSFDQGSGRYYIVPSGRYSDLFVDEMMLLLWGEIRHYFVRTRRGNVDMYVREWGLALELDSGHVVRDEFWAETRVVLRNGGGFVITTEIRKFTGSVSSVAAVVQSEVVWCLPSGGEYFDAYSGKININFLDYYTITMVELMRIAD